MITLRIASGAASAGLNGAHHIGLQGRRFLAEDEGRVHRRERADVPHLLHFPFAYFRLHQLRVHNGFGEQCNDRAVARGVGIEKGGRHHTATAGLVFDDDRGGPGDESLEVIGSKTRIEVVRAAGWMAKHDTQALGLVEISDGIG